MNSKILGSVGLVIDSKQNYTWKQGTKGKGNTVSFLIPNNSVMGDTKLSLCKGFLLIIIARSGANNMNCFCRVIGCSCKLEPSP